MVLIVNNQNIARLEVEVCNLQFVQLGEACGDVQCDAVFLAQVERPLQSRSQTLLGEWQQQAALRLASYLLKCQAS